MPIVIVQPGVIKKNSSQYFLVCSLGGILSCGITHTLVTPIDLVKCNKQNNPDLFNKGIFKNIRILTVMKGLKGLYRGWAPTAVGYSFQGLGKFGLNDIFKYRYGLLLGNGFSEKYPRLFYAICSGSAEFFADILLCPWETIKLKIQTSEINNWLEGIGKGYSDGIFDGTKRLFREEGLRGMFNILEPLWARQIPYTIIKFVAFEDFIRRIYSYTTSIWSKNKHDFNKTQQLGFTFIAGYGAGIFCGAISHPADTIASLLAKSPGRDFNQLYHNNGGFIGLWKGFGARVFMIGTLTGLQWFIYDTTKVLFGLQAGGDKK